MKLSIVIPCYNERETIAAVIAAVRAAPGGEKAREVFADSFAWIAEHEIFPTGSMGSGRYEDAVVTLGR